MEQIPPFYWDDLLDFLINERRVVPVVGCELLEVQRNGATVPFMDLMGETLAARLSAMGGSGLPTSGSLAEIVTAALNPRSGIRRSELTRELNPVHRGLLAEFGGALLPEPLRLLAEITDFPLILTTTPDGLLASAYKVRPDETLASTLSENADLPPEWQPPRPDLPAPCPTIVHLFGRITATPGFALTEEDTLEFMSSLYGDKRPARLLSLLRRRHILLVGNRFPDWLARFFLRLLRGERLSAENAETFEALVDSEAQPFHALVTFLRAFSPQTRIWRDGNPSAFIRELHARWLARQPEAKAAPTMIEADHGEPEDMAPGSVFISYATEDRAAASALWSALDAAGIDAWFDRKDLRGGDRYTSKIRRHIQQCDLFVPLFSRHTEARQDAFFRREWSWARDRLPSIGPSRKFIMPLVVDDVDAYSSPDLSHYFELPGSELHVDVALRGRPDPGLLLAFVKAIHAIRSPQARRSAA